MDRQEAAFIEMAIEQRELLVAMHDIDCVVDIQRDRARRAGGAGAVNVDHRVAQAHHFAQIGSIFPARDGCRRAPIGAAVGQPSAGQLEAGIAAQMIEIVGILVTAGNRQHAGTQDVGHAVRHHGLIAPIGNQRRQTIGNPNPPLNRRQQHHPAIRCQTPAVKCGSELLAADRWKRERRNGSVGHGGGGSACSCGQDRYDTQSVSPINALRDTRQRFPAMP